jgi:sialic acid synthase SpsE/sugar phosphate isomerase/epimerase
MSEVTHLQIGERLVGEGQPCFIIAEAGVNHNGSLDMALKLVDVAARAGADAVKFQKRDLKKLYPQQLLDDPNSAEWAFQYMLPILQQTELTDDDFRAIKKHCDQVGIRFMCTPWDVTSFTFLEELGVEAYKVASADLVNLPLLDHLVETGKPLILSTGMANPEEITFTVEYLKKKKAQFAILHCVSTYPAPFENLNLRYIETLKKFGVPVGYSSHERGISIPIAALTLGACIIEKHITLDRTLPGPDHPASLEPGGIEKLVRDIRNAELALGGDNSTKTLSAMEKLNRQVLMKSLVARHDLPSGTIVTHEMVAVKGPGKGLSPQRVNELIGSRLDRDIAQDEPFIEQDLMAKRSHKIYEDRLTRPWGLKARFHDFSKILEKNPRVIELHFSESDVDYQWTPPAQPYDVQLFVHAPEFAERRLLDFCSPDDEVQTRAVNLIQRTIDKAVELRPHFKGDVGVVVHVGGMHLDRLVDDAGERRELVQRAIEGLKKLDMKGIRLLPENLPPRPWYLGGQWFQNVFIRAEEMIQVCEALNVGMTFDLCHAQLYCNWDNVTLHDFAREVGPYAHHLHISDATGIDGEGVQVGEGCIEWEKVLAEMEPYQFTWVPEIWSGHLNNGAGFVDAVNRLAAYGKL